MPAASYTLALPKLIEPLFVEAGWKPSGTDREPTELYSSPRALAAAIIDEYGGLHIGSCGPGTEMASSDIQFYSTIREDVGEAIGKPWVEKIGSVEAFATAHHDHMILFAGSDHNFYIFTDPDDRMHHGGNDFGELMRILLWGYPFGPNIPGNTRTYRPGP